MSFGPSLRFDAYTFLTVAPSGEIYVASRPFIGWLDAERNFHIVEGAVARIGARIDPAGYSGDGGPAVRARLNIPRGPAVDATGAVFFADSGNSVVRMIARDGTIATVAGNGKRGYSGEGAPATSATLFAPAAVAVSPDGSLYIADTNNHRVRRVDHGGNIATIAGTGDPGFAGDGGPATLAEIDTPLGLAFDSHANLYIADSGNNRVRKVSADGSIKTVAGNGDPRMLSAPSAVAIDPADVLYVADPGNHRISKLSGG